MTSPRVRVLRAVITTLVAVAVVATAIAGWTAWRAVQRYREGKAMTTATCEDLVRADLTRPGSAEFTGLSWSDAERPSEDDHMAFGSDVDRTVTVWEMGGRVTGTTTSGGTASADFSCRILILDDGSRRTSHEVSGGDTAGLVR